MIELAQILTAHASAAWVSFQRRLNVPHRNERGSVTIQEVIWAVAAIGFATAIVAVVKVFLDTQAAKIH